MKKNIPYILIAVLILTQFVTFSRISVLQGEIESAKNEINNLHNSTTNEVNAIYSNVDEMLKREASLIESASTKIGMLNLDALTVPVEFSITPKEVSENTAVSLDFDGAVFPMDKIGTSFIATISQDIFDSVFPMIVIDENGIKKTTQDSRVSIGSIKDSLFPELHPRIIGEGRYSAGSYKWKGTLNTKVKESISGIAFTEMRFLITIDDKVFSEEVIPIETAMNWPIDKTISLADGQVCMMTVIAIDNIGLEHRHIVEHWNVGSNRRRELLLDDGQIYSADGKLLWSREYKRMDGEIILMK